MGKCFSGFSDLYKMLFFNKDYIFKYLHIKLLLEIKNIIYRRSKHDFHLKIEKPTYFPVIIFSEYTFLYKNFI